MNNPAAASAVKRAIIQSFLWSTVWAILALALGWWLCRFIRRRSLRIVARTGLVALLFTPTIYWFPDLHGGFPMPAWSAILLGLRRGDLGGVLYGVVPVGVVWLLLASISLAISRRRAARSVDALVDAGKVSFSPNRGSSCDDLILIDGARTDREGIDAELVWLSRNYPGYQKLRANRGHCPNRVVDVVEIRTPDGHHLEVMFDVTSTYAKV